MVDPRLNANPKVDEAFLRRDLKLYAVGDATNDHFVVESTHFRLASPFIVKRTVRLLLLSDAHLLTDIEYEIEPAGIASVRYPHQQFALE